MDIQLISMDLDGTALQNDRCSFSLRLIRALEVCHARGIRIVPVTGRQFGMLPPALCPPPIWGDLVVLCNGAQIRRFSTGEVVFQTQIAPDALHALLQLACSYDLPIEFSIDSVLHLTEHSLALQQGIENLKFHLDTILVHHGKIVEDLGTVVNLPVEKVNLPHIPPRLHRAVEQALEAIAVSAVWSSDTSMEITHPDACKGNALRQLSQLLQIPTEHMMALGDSGNDESMLRTAGFGVAMGNAPAWIKALADAVTEPNDCDGAAIAIERYALKL